MSGTSLDGLDLAFCHIWEVNSHWNYTIKETKSVSYSTKMLSKLQNSILLPSVELLSFHNTYGIWLGQQTKKFIDQYNLDVDYIASHGHTTHHRPEMSLTFQIGSGQHLANASGQKVICDFRTNDVALRGQGAPLVPIGDELFFNTYDFCLNLGGIANISFNQNGERKAYDVGLANMILNHITRKKGLDYDNGGALARKGNVNTKLLKQLDSLQYYRLSYPKSIGYEWFVEQVVPLVDSAKDAMENLLCTAIHHICKQIAIQVKANSKKNDSSLLVTGGGAFNDYLIEILQQELGSHTKVIVPEKKLIEFKEALVFALMGVLRIKHNINVLCSVTGAESDSSSGVVFLPS